MCGICGIFDPHHRLSFSQVEADISRMMNEFRYRGPDAQGTYFDPTQGIGLGHVRLSIIDLASGQQPMAHAEGRLRLVFNGEIYNFKTERDALEKKGVQFQTHSDTEVILALYQQYGIEGWGRLRGQFAIGLWDALEKSLFLVRDRLGEKPLVYSHYNDTLFFASELKALLKSPTLPKDLDESSLGLYFLMQHIPAPGTLIKRVQKLPPGYFLKTTANGVQLQTYWKPMTSVPLASTKENDIIDNFRALFQEAVALCTVSDVPIGTFLSGGLDSTSVTWAVKQRGSQPLHTFAIFNRENHEQHPDWKFAQEAAASLQTEHHNVLYDLPELMQQIPEFIEKSDEPFEGPTALVSLFLSKFTRQYVKVVLTGSGGDELLAGYQAYYQRVFRTQNMWQAIDRWMPKGVRSPISHLLGPLHPNFRRVGLPHEERRAVGTLQYHSNWFNQILPGQAAATRAKFQEALGLHHSQDIPNYFMRYLWEDLVVNHNHAIMTMPDTTGMACSLEARNPFLDYKLVEFLLHVGPDLLIRHAEQNKYLLVKAMEGRIPSSILYRSKQGFSGMTADQIIHWMKTEGRPLFQDSLLDSLLVKHGVLSRQGLEQLWKNYETAESPQKAIYYQIPIWSATMLELWYRRHLATS